MRVLRTIAGILVCVVLGGSAAHAQVLPLRRDIPAQTPFTCAAVAVGDASPVEPGPRQEAARLITDAANASILGDHLSARERLTRAASLDPSDATIAFRLARTLEELGSPAPAAREYCRYLALARNARDADDVRDVIERIAPPHRVGVPDTAVALFSAGLALADGGRLDAAIDAFTEVIDAAPGWAAPRHNRGVIRAALRQRDAARDDLARVLELEPDGGTTPLVTDWISQLDSRRPRYSTGTALVASVIPGAGHFYTGRPGRGMLLLAGAGGAAAAGVLIQTRTIECLTIPTGGVCPSDQIRNEILERPYFTAGVGVAAALTVLGAIDAVRGAGRKNAVAPIIRFSAGDSGDGLRFVLPDIKPNGSRVDVAFRIELPN